MRKSFNGESGYNKHTNNITQTNDLMKYDIRITTNNNTVKLNSIFYHYEKGIVI